MDIHDGKIKGTLSCTGGNMLLNKIEKIINNNVKDIIYCFDNDIQGKKMIDFIKDKLKNYNINHIIHLPKNKDWNDDLKKIKSNEF